jgi:hypothetical protein
MSNDDSIKIKFIMSRCQIDNDVSMPVDPPGKTLASDVVTILLHYAHIIRKMEGGKEVWHCFPLTPRQQRGLDRKLYRAGPEFAANKRKQRKPRFTKQRRSIVS